MIRRILILAGYFSKGVVFSVTGLLLILFGLVYWAIFFPPGQTTPDIENYIILIGSLGAAATFFSGLVIAGRASRLETYPMLVRLPSRVEYLVAVLLATIALGLFIQLLVAGLALLRGPDLVVSRLLAIPPIWLSVNVLAAILAMHASDLVTAGWSRVIIFSLLAFALILNSASPDPESWFSERLFGLVDILNRINLVWFADVVSGAAGLAGSSLFALLTQTAAIMFWPFRALSDAVLSGGFSASQALAPAVIVLYSAILFLIAAILFCGKDLDFVE
ncbi:MAG TPA: hypothetical protein VF434_09500 [Promineifilum sp.]